MMYHGGDGWRGSVKLDGVEISDSVIAADISEGWILRAFEPLRVDHNTGHIATYKTYVPPRRIELELHRG